MAADKRAARLGVLALVATLLFGAMGTRLWFLQTVQADSLQQVVDARKTKTVRLVPERGRIFDVDGRIMADNDAVLSVAVEWDVISRRETDRAELFTRLSGWVGVPVEEMEARYDSDLYSRYKPLPIAEDIGEDVAVAIEERSEDFPGVTVEKGWKRVYPYAPLASHVVGYMGSITAEDEKEYLDLGYDTSLGGENVGRSGIELSYEDALHGKWGEVVYEVDADNRIVREISRSEPVNGMDVQLSIDLDVQQYTERLLQTQLRRMRNPALCVANPEVAKPDGTRGPLDTSRAVGTCVPYSAPAGSTTVMNHHSGQVMAMASYPTFDNRWFSTEVDDAKFDEIFPTETPDRELDPDTVALPNRAIQGQYNLGSTFKVFTAYAALATGRISPNTTFDDQGTYELQSITQRDKCVSGVIRCVFRNSFCVHLNGPCRYGTINVLQSLAVSSDAFYYKLGEDFYVTPGTQLQDQVKQFGLGADTGIDLPFEFDGRVPTNEVKAALIESGALSEDEAATMQPGDVLLMAIGQGLLAATPLQLAVGYSTFANGGSVLQPRVVQAILEPETPDGDPGFADMTQAVVAVQVAPVITRQIPMTEDIRGPIEGGIRRNITGPGFNGASTTAEELFRDYPADAIQVAGKTGTAQGRFSYPWNDSSAFAAYSIQPEHPYTVVTYLEKSGFGSTGAAPVVKCTFLALSGRIAFDPVQMSEPLDTAQTVPAEPLPDVDTACMARNDNPVRPDD